MHRERRRNKFRWAAAGIATCQLTFLLFLATGATSCRQSSDGQAAVWPLYAEVGTPPIAGWNATDTLVFNLPVLDSTQDINLDLSVRTTNAYPLRNLQLRTTLVDTDTQAIVQTGRVGFTIFDTNDRHSGNGFLFTTSQSATIHALFQGGHHYQLRVTHTMRQRPLPGVSALAVRIMKQ